MADNCAGDGGTHLGSFIVKRHSALNVGGLAGLSTIGPTLSIIGGGPRLRMGFSLGLELGRIGLVDAAAKHEHAQYD
jgi:hypothetical protein